MARFVSALTAGLTALLVGSLIAGLSSSARAAEVAKTMNAS